MHPEIVKIEAMFNDGDLDAYMTHEEKQEQIKPGVFINRNLCIAQYYDQYKKEKTKVLSKVEQ